MDTHPLDMCLEDFTPVNEVQKQFVQKVEQIVHEYTKLLAQLVYTQPRQAVSSTRVAEIGDLSCRGPGFMSMQLGFSIADHEERVLFYDYYGASSLFSIVQRCPHPLDSDDEHYHMIGNSPEDGVGSEHWRRFPVREVLGGLERLIVNLTAEQRSFMEANRDLDKRLAITISSTKRHMPDTTASSPAQ